MESLDSMADLKEIGNPTSYYNGTRWTFTWTNGRELTTASNGTNDISYTYGADGLRTCKTVDGEVYTYYYMGLSSSPPGRADG